MLIDFLEQAGAWKLDNEDIRFALQWLAEPATAGLAPGTYELRGRAVYAVIAEYATRPADSCRLETHRDYIDVQYVARGAELMGYAPLSQLEPDGAYDAQRDVQFHRGRADFVLLRQGMFAIMTPEDGHMPGVAADGQSGPVKKIVVKVRSRH